MDIYSVIKSSLSTEKSESLKDLSNTYTFKVDSLAKKPNVKRAVEELFNVKVSEVRTSIQRGKKVTRHGKTVGKRSNWKKAYVRLAEGQKIDLVTTV